VHCTVMEGNPSLLAERIDCCLLRSQPHDISVTLLSFLMDKCLSKSEKFLEIDSPPSNELLAKSRSHLQMTIL